jgi:hypothetical protein
MMTLPEAIQRLTEMLPQLAPGLPLYKGILVFEVPPELRYDVDGRLPMYRSAFVAPQQKEAMFERLLTYAPWVNVSAYGIFEGRLLVGIEYKHTQRADLQKAPAINFSGPMVKVRDRGWDATAILAIRDD